MSVLSSIAVFVIRLYQWTLAPTQVFLFGPMSRCRFTPSCSQYAIEAIRRHGLLTGCRLAASRVCRCHPWGDCGHDPVPLANLHQPESNFPGHGS